MYGLTAVTVYVRIECTGAEVDRCLSTIHTFRTEHINLDPFRPFHKMSQRMAARHDLEGSVFRKEMESVTTPCLAAPSCITPPKSAMPTCNVISEQALFQAGERHEAAPLLPCSDLSPDIRCRSEGRWLVTTVRCLVNEPPFQRLRSEHYLLTWTLSAMGIESHKQDWSLLPVRTECGLSQR